jgi:hypothetical protein
MTGLVRVVYISRVGFSERLTRATTMEKAREYMAVNADRFKNVRLAMRIPVLFGHWFNREHGWARRERVKSTLSTRRNKKERFRYNLVLDSIT